MGRKNNNLSRENTLLRDTLFILFALPGFLFANWISRTPEIKDELNISTAAMGVVLFGLAMGSVIGLLTSSKFIKFKGARYVTVFDFIILFTGLIVVSFAVLLKIPYLVFIGLMIFGIGHGSADVAINIEGTELERKTKKIFLPGLHAFLA